MKLKDRLKCIRSANTDDAKKLDRQNALLKKLLQILKKLNGS